jgi:hypothetical protein
MRPIDRRHLATTVLIHRLEAGQSRMKALHMVTIVAAFTSLLCGASLWTVPAGIVAGLALAQYRSAMVQRMATEEPVEDEEEPLEKLDLHELFTVIALAVPAVMIFVSPSVGACSFALALWSRRSIEDDEVLAIRLRATLPSRLEPIALGVVAGGTIAPIMRERGAAVDPPRPIPAPASGRCAACGVLDGPPAWVACPACDAHHHADCWDFADGCAIYGCGRRTEAPALPPGSILGPPKKS